MLDEIRKLVADENLIRTLDTTAVLFRVRLHGPEENCADWKALGPPPSKRAPSNRMSPAGISMFYASTDQQTARAEAKAILRAATGLRMTSAAWFLTRPLRLLDLCGIPTIPSFWFTPRDERDRTRFLHAFTADISKSVIHDGREHIEYVPTQILTEYFRDEFQTNDGEHLDGILYPSAQRKGGKNVVIFAGQDDLVPAAERRLLHNPPLLALDTTSIKRLRNRR